MDNSKRKRRKLQHGGSKSSSSQRRAFPMDALSWRSVDVSGNHLDDAEGFYGLEEVEGVEVTRDGNGQIHFVANAASAIDADEFEGFDDKPASGDSIEDSNAVDAELHDRAHDAEAPESFRSSDAEDSNEELEPLLFTKLGQVEAWEGHETNLPSWEPLNLSEDLLRSLARLQFETPTPIQKAAIPQIAAGRDVIGKAVTGSGKTLAFAIPIVEKWLSLRSDSGQPKQHPLALVMSPTRELAHQITKHFQDLCGGLAAAPYICSVTGGLSVQKQRRLLETADVVIGTPGRLWEVLSSDSALLASFKNMQFLVLDEADRLVADGHFEEAKEILNALNRTEYDEDGQAHGPRPSQSRQTLVFSATFNKALQQRLAGKGRFDNLMDSEQSLEYLLKRINFRERPVFLDVNPVSQMATALKEGIIECGAMEKDLYLYSVLLLHPAKRTLVFTNSISTVRRLTPMLQNLNLPTHPLQSQMPQKARLRSLERFASTQRQPAGAATSSHILVATDVAARGLDISDIDLVIHYHVPRTADAYVHRSGRTARAEKAGASILLCSPAEVIPTRRLVAKVHATAQAKAAEKVAVSGRKKSKDDAAFFIQKIDLDRKLVARLRDRVTLAKTLSDAALAREKGRAEDSQMRQAAEDLGVEYDSEEMEKTGGRWSGRGSGRKEKEKSLRSLTKRDVAVLQAQLSQLLAERVNLGVSERYIASGKVDIAKLLEGGKGAFLGDASRMGFDL